MKKRHNKSNYFSDLVNPAPIFGGQRAALG